MTVELDCLDLVKMINQNLNELPRTKLGMACRRMMKMKTQFLEIGFEHTRMRNNEMACVVTRVYVTRTEKDSKSIYTR